MDSDFDIKEEILTSESIGNKEIHDLMVFDDDYNTFDHVIRTLIKVCKHHPHQAEQCTYLIHHRGKCSVKKGTYRHLVPMREGITSNGIKASIV